MKKVIVLLAMTGIMGYASAQTTEDVAAPASAGQEVKSVAQGTPSEDGKGLIVSETAKVKGTEMSEKAKEKGTEMSDKAKGKNAGESVETGDDNHSSENHGSDVKAVATDETLSGKDKADAVKAKATSKGESKRNSARAETGKAKRDKYAASRKPAQVRSTGAKRPSSGAGRPSNAGRPAR